MKSTRLRLDPQGYIAGDAGVTQRVCAQAFSAVLGQVVSMRDRERARDGSVNILSLRTLRVFSDHKQETDSSTKGLVCLPLNQVKDTELDSARIACLIITCAIFIPGGGYPKGI